MPASSPDDHRLPARLPINVRPRQGESVASYVERLAIANHLAPTLLRANLQGSSDFRGRPQLDRLAAASGRTQEVLRRTLAGLLCERCAAPLRLKVQGAARWCSATCRQMAYRQRHRERFRPAPRPPIVNSCEACGTSFTSPAPSRWCSRDCRRAGQPPRQRCGRCNAVLPRDDPRGLPRLWCSDACRVWAYRERRKQRPKAAESTAAEPQSLKLR
ncbi:TniQ family protein [Streptosporangium canum]|uniref:TniQ family protein n=1 Tax=Streptosporangium canum TaxID=324952 RepID=UPI0037A18527